MAKLVTTVLPVGTDVLTALYIGDSGYKTSGSGWGYGWRLHKDSRVRK